MITIHEKTAQTFDTLGLGTLFPSSCVVREALNGAYELKMEHPYDIWNNPETWGKWNRIEQERIIYASTPIGMQPFRIYNISPDMKGIVVNARHIFYDLLDNQSGAVSFTGTADNILNAWKGTFYTEMPFIFETDMTHEGAMKTDRVNPVQALLSDDDDMTSFVKGCGGEIRRDHFRVSILAAMGQDRDVAIRYGKNLVGLEVAEDATDVKTRFLCYGPYGSFASLDSPHIGNYVYPKIYTLEDDHKTVDELKSEAQEMLDSGVDLPLVNIKVDFVELTKTVEYKDYAPLEQVFLGDIVTVINQKMNFAKKAKVISYEWNCLLNRYDEVELGDFMPSLAASVTSGARSGSVASSASATAASVAALLNNHMMDYNNPHKVTAVQIGGSSGGSTDTDADAVLELLVEHEENKENPHEVTLAQVGFTSGTDAPDDATGKEGDVYLQIGGGYEYTPIEFIESSGTQYIDTLFKPNQNTRVVMDFQLLNASGWRTLFGARKAAGTNQVQFALWRNETSQFSFGYASSVVNFSGALDSTVRYIGDANRNTLTIDVESVTVTASTFQSTVNMYLFASNGGGTAEMEYASSMRLYSCKIYDNDVLVRDYIPVRDKNGVACLFDKIEKKYYYNAGTGEFSAPSASYTPVEHIASSGGAFINTNFVPNQNTRVVCNAIYTQDSSASYLFGSDGGSGVAYFAFGAANGNLRLAYNTSSYYFTTGLSFAEKITIDVNKNVATINGEHSVTAPEATFNSGYPLYLFGDNRKGSLYGAYDSIIESVQVYDGDVLVKDLIAVIDANGEPCMYDKLNNVYYRNKGTGAFTAGAEIPQASGAGALWLKQNGTWTQVLKGAA